MSSLTSIAFVCLVLPGALSLAQTPKKDPVKIDSPEVTVGKPLPAPVEERDAVQLTKKLAEKYAAVKRFAFEGDLQVARQVGEDPKEELTKAHVKLETAPGGKFLVSVKREGAEYSFLSDGAKTWTYVPAMAQYTERSLTPVDKRLDAQAVPLLNVLEGEGDITERFAKQIMPVLTRTLKSPSMSFMRGSVLTVIGQKDTRGQQALFYLTVNPSTLAIPRLTWLEPAQLKDTKYMVRSDMRFTNLRLDADVPDSDFIFHPPADAKKVETLDVPGRKS